MDNRRDFLKKAALLSSSSLLSNTLPPVIQKALAVAPEVGSTFYDAEHIVFLMQENRSFDHQLGMLQGVRGFNDPRVIQLPDQNTVWLQTNAQGDTYGPFHLNVKDTKVAWMGSLPHGWTDQTDAMNNGKYDKWLDTKKARNKAFNDMPLTMGYCDREDFPFYYSLADAFTVCDHNFCSSITGTHPNRHYWMTGTVREKNEPEAIAHLWNVNNYEYPTLNWTTYPERLQAAGVPWKVYQNEITMGYGLKGEESAWLSNFGTNVLEYYQQYNVRLHEGGIANLQAKNESVRQLIAELEKQPADEKTAQKLAAARKLLTNIETAQRRYTTDGYANLSTEARQLHDSAFVTNRQDSFFHELTAMAYSEAGAERTLNVPKGDVFHQFRQDVQNGTLPTVSWLMPPAHFSDHPGQPWFGPWYVSEAMEILLQNPEVWKKTIFIITYDENDGYFDHMPPYVVPNPYKSNTGKVSAGIDPRLDFVTKEQQTNPSAQTSGLREGPIGLGYRVPMIVASPWTRGGYVNSEVFDHTSSLQFLEHFLAKKTGKTIREENITEWRRTVCGDLTSVFRPYNGEPITQPKFLERGPFIEGIHQAQFKNAPANYQKLAADTVKQINAQPEQSSHLPQQEKGIRSACALPYELYVDRVIGQNNGQFGLSFKAGKTVFGEQAAGAPFRVYAVRPYQGEPMRAWDYSVAAGDLLQDEWSVGDFDASQYHLRVYGPNGFYREFTGGATNPLLQIECQYEPQRLRRNKLTGNLQLTVHNRDTKAHTLTLLDNSYKGKSQQVRLPAGAKTSVPVDLNKQHGWYDLSVQVKGHDGFEERFAGHIETGNPSKTDPLMGRVV
ncbi:phospholipase C, phosphocholine-specific [Spirosoma sp. RP8]|uniref:phospholipase C n=1 Tax=Spirosoma liriopis TaxID=2937440 RepID=A0ABT0HSZ3_9BACT|nr:phospholipase C, phosphocholine-specific [Spirosoma liriopis]MCK8494947.1 phospholipase C, phosphocholine-specific [Spirosoma liriopis]